MKEKEKSFQLAFNETKLNNLILSLREESSLIKRFPSLRGNNAPNKVAKQTDEERVRWGVGWENRDGEGARQLKN